MSWRTFWCSRPGRYKGFPHNVRHDNERTKYVPPGKYDALEKAIAEGDSWALHRLYPDEDSKIASFYCHECEAPYCREHWQLEEVIEEEMLYVDY